MIEYFEIWWCIPYLFWSTCFLHLSFIRDWVLLLSFGSFLLNFFLLLFASLLASHCWEGIALSFPLMCFTSFFKFSISSFGEKLTLSSLVFVFFLNFLWFLFTLLFCPSLEPWFALTCSSLLVRVCSYVVYPLYIFISSKAAFASSAVM